jgi:hypothetical protein
MSGLSDMFKFKKQRASSVLGLALDGSRLEGVVVRRLNGSLQVQQSFSEPLALAPLTGAPELVGREIRNLLDKAGVREKRCALCIPLNWLLTLQTKLPELPEADVAGFLQLEAERGFHAGPENLFIASSRCNIGAGEQYATLVAMPRTHIATLEAVMKAAQLKPLTYSMGVSALAGAVTDSPQGVLTLSLGAAGVDLLVAAGSGIFMLRSLEGVVEGEGAQRRIDAGRVAREIRITLGQLPAVVGERMGAVRICGHGEIARQFERDITPGLQEMGLRLEVMDRASAAQFDKPLPAEIAQSPALALAANYVKGVAGVELLPPRVQPWQRLLTSSKMSSQRLVWAGGAAAAVVLCLGGAFGFQEWELVSLQSQTMKVEPQVKSIRDALDQSRKFAAWGDDSFPALNVLKAVAEAFPQEGGAASAKNIEIHDEGAVTCSGTANDNQSYLRLLDRLRNASQVSDLKTDTVRGQAPLEFVFNFQWGEGGSGGN